MKNYLYISKCFYKQINANHGVVTDARGIEFFVHKRNRNNALSGDEVEIKITKREDANKKAEAEISKIITKSKQNLVGVFLRRKGQDFAFIRAYNTFDGKDVFVYSENFAGAQNEDIILFKINKGVDKPVGEVVRIIGNKNQNDINEKIILLESGLRIDFSTRVSNEAKNIKTRLDMKNRLDITSDMVFTIDGADAKDLDDAISIKKNINGTYVLGVHIADVAEYVTEGSELNLEAKKRGTSVYIPGQVIPMLPSELSNGLCSLHPGEPKATLSIFMNIDSKGNVLDKKITNTLIKSKARLTYDEVHEFLNQKKITKNLENERLRNDLELSNELYKIIYSRRKRHGKIEFDFPELKIEVDEKGTPTKIEKRDRNDAHKLIEEFMIMANEEISKYFYENKIPFLYRIHEKPSEEGLEELSNVLKEYRISFNPQKDLNPLFFSNIVDSMKGKKDEYIVSKQILMSMSKAKYDNQALGHFGLALKYYSHFTSPIRRYPDLQIHRIIKEYLAGNMTKKEILRYTKILGKVAKSCSTSEQKAEDIERKIISLKSIEYMQKFVGEEFVAKISGMTMNGLYAELENGIEGFIIGKNLENYSFSEEKKCYQKTGSKDTLRLGDKIKIKVLKADKNMGFLDYELI